MTPSNPFTPFTLHRVEGHHSYHQIHLHHLHQNKDAIGVNHQNERINTPLKEVGHIDHSNAEYLVKDAMRLDLLIP